MERDCEFKTATLYRWLAHCGILQLLILHHLRIVPGFEISCVLGVSGVLAFCVAVALWVVVFVASCFRESPCSSYRDWYVSQSTTLELFQEVYLGS